MASSHAIDEYMSGRISFTELMGSYDAEIRREIKQRLPRWIAEQKVERARLRLVAKLRRRES